ncbi:dihydrolipoyl dehydrogenase family protein [Leifsonia sp. Root112D2]|uniref:dihydrolipoyl dehydrogenase family protein n=1 Tax=Leifsonia sp. Root112D2 TaxID=1736426 RepID=UPI0006FD2127|nr:FAD-dependent oxidoreductase [Leifsonia sp. Root112D2]KQV08137.1 mercuric reductase [Leifsonia sp. Root112D2]
MEAIEEFDLVVVGGGKGGKSLAMDRAKAGARVAMVERGMIGGSCINVACIPTKTLVTSARAVGTIARAAKLGIRVDGSHVDLDLLRAHKEGVVGDMVKMNYDLFIASGMDFILGSARFTAPRTIEVTTDAGRTRLLRGTEVVINTGTRPIVPAIEGIDTVGVMTSEDVLRLESIPGRVAVIGGGYIGAELAQMLHRFGSELTMLVRGERLLAREEPEISQALAEVFTAEGIDVRFGAEATQVARQDDGAIEITLGDTSRLTVDALVVATGREPVTEGLHLHEAGVETNAAGFVIVDEKLATTAAHTWAAGDVAGHPQFTHVSFDDFRILKANITGGDRSTSGRLIPSVVFVEPEIATIGLTEADARAAGIDVVVAAQPVIAVPRSRTLRQTKGLWKIVIDRASDRIVGASLMGAESGEVLAVIQVAMLAGAPFTLLRDAILAHPTMAEGLNTAFAGVTASSAP